jgi:tellurite resistance protein
MLFETKPLDQLTEDDVRTLLISMRRREGATLEYKKEAYKHDDRGAKEFLLDACMFANSGGGDIVIGISELRDDKGNATGYPDAEVTLGIELANPEQQLLSYESQILDAIDERVAIKLRAIPCGNLYILIVRVPNSLAKPHRVHYQGRTYFPARRERRRYEMNAREIKELVMRTASQSEKAETMVNSAVQVTEWSDRSPLLVAALLPVFSSNFCVDLQSSDVRNAFAHLSVNTQPDEYVPQPNYTVDGLSKRAFRNGTLSLGHNGLLKLFGSVPSGFNETHAMSVFMPTAIDIFLRGLVIGAEKVLAAAGLGAPVLLQVSLLVRQSFYPKYSDWDDPIKLPPRDHYFPSIALTAIGPGAETQIKPLCDHIHQAFGRVGSPSFDAEGNWIPRK